MTIYTHNEAADIVELFENVLDKYNITLPSPEDDERDPENDAKLYGSTYSDLLDAVESHLVYLFERLSDGDKVVSYVYGGFLPS